MSHYINRDILVKTKILTFVFLFGGLILFASSVGTGGLNQYILENFGINFGFNFLSEVVMAVIFILLALFFTVSYKLDTGIWPHESIEKIF